MELRPCRFSFFDAHVVPAVVDGNGYARQRIHDLLGPDPVFRVFGVIVVKVHGNTVAADEIVVAAVPILVLSANVVVPDDLQQ